VIEFKVTNQIIHFVFVLKKIVYVVFLLRKKRILYVVILLQKRIKPKRHYNIKTIMKTNY